MVFLWYNLAIILILKILFEVIMSWPEETAYERYPSDLTDEEWEIVKPILEKLDPYTTGRPRKIGPVNFPVMARVGSAGLGRQPHPTP